MGHPDYKLLIIDRDGQTSRRICEFLNSNGFEAEYAGTGELGIEKIKLFQPRFIVCDLMLPDMNATDILDFVKTHPEIKNRELKILIASSHNNKSNIKTCIQKGACDYIIKPLKPESLLPRLIFHAQKKRQIVEHEKVAVQTLQGGDLHMHLLSLVLKESVSKKSEHEILFNMTKMMAMSLKAVRCSIMECMDDRATGYVRASHDNIDVNALKIDLEKYPEVTDVMNREQPVIIENLDSDPILAEIKKNFKNISFNSILVFPLYKRGNFFGVLSARMDGKVRNFTESQLRFSMMMSQIIGLILSAQMPVPIELQRHSA